MKLIKVLFIGVLSYLFLFSVYKVITVNNAQLNKYGMHIVCTPYGICGIAREE